MRKWVTADRWIMEPPSAHGYETSWEVGYYIWVELGQLYRILEIAILSETLVDLLVQPASEPDFNPEISPIWRSSSSLSDEIPL